MLLYFEIFFTKIIIHLIVDGLNPSKVNLVGKWKLFNVIMYFLIFFFDIVLIIFLILIDHITFIGIRFVIFPVFLLFISRISLTNTILWEFAIPSVGIRILWILVFIASVCISYFLLWIVLVCIRLTDIIDTLQEFISSILLKFAFIFNFVMLLS